MELKGTRTLSVPVTQAWRALNDPETLKVAIPGCESLELEGENTFRVTLLARVGPVSARFGGKAQLLDVDAPRGYSIRFEGNAGATGFVRGDIHVTLASAGAAATRLDYRANALVGGKLAQVGSRLIDAAANKVVEDFFTRFVVAATTEFPVPTEVRRFARLRRWWAALIARFR